MNASGAVGSVRVQILLEGGRTWAAAEAAAAHGHAAAFSTLLEFFIDRAVLTVY